MKDILLIVQITVSVLLAISILMQLRGSGLGTAFGEAGEHYRSRRGVEKLLQQTTIFLTALFLITSVIALFIK